VLFPSSLQLILPVRHAQGGRETCLKCKSVPLRQRNVDLAVFVGEKPGTESYFWVNVSSVGWRTIRTSAADEKVVESCFHYYVWHPKRGLRGVRQTEARIQGTPPAFSG
jgi:hypothetical protein